MTLNRMLARFGMLVVSLLVLAMNVIAQGKTVTGTVTDSKDGTPLSLSLIHI